MIQSSAGQFDFSREEFSGIRKDMMLCGVSFVILLQYKVTLITRPCAINVPLVFCSIHLYKIFLVFASFKDSYVRYTCSKITF